MQIDFFDVDKFCENLKEVSSNKIYARRDFHEQGLFSQKIFGPIKNYTCGCGTYFGRSKAGQICKTCEVEITHSSERRRRFAKIRLPFSVCNPIMFYILCKIGKVSIKDVLTNLLLSEQTIGYWYDEDAKRYVHITENDPIPEGKTIYSGISGAYEIAKALATDRKDDNPDWKFIFDNIEKFYMNNIIVLPPAFRPTSKTKDVQKRDQLNDTILTILNFTLTKNEELLDSDKESKIHSTNVRNLQKYVFEMYDFILGKFSKKTGIIRDSILGKRNDFSGRAVIAPEPMLKLDECTIPYGMLLELYKLEIANMLHEKRRFKTFASAVLHIDECIKKNDYDLYPIVDKVCTGRYVILNRQPTLHRMGILAFRIKPNKETVIQIHPMACEPFNADFDGDQMAVYRALYQDAEKECEEKLLLSKNLISPTTGDLITGINQDIVLGLYLLTMDGATPDIEVSLIDDENEGLVVLDIDELYESLIKANKSSHDKIKQLILKMKKDRISYVKTTQGRFKFFQCLPLTYQIQFLKRSKSFDEKFNQAVVKKNLIIFLNDIARVFPKEVVETLDKIKELGLFETTKFGSTMSLHNMKLPDAEKISSSILDDDKLSIGERVAKLKGDEVMKLVKANFRYAMFIESGSRGSWDQARQIVLARGYVSNSQGAIIQEPIRNNYVHGLNRTEFFNSSYGTRKGLLDTALNTGVSGYLTRKTVYTTANLELDYNNQDCGTIDTLKVIVDTSQLARSLVGRFHINKDGMLEEITLANYFKIKGMQVNLRSPIFCQSKHLCKTCYGKNSEIAKSKYIGIIASQALGEVGTQLVMRTFHTSGVAQDVTSTKTEGKESTNQQEDIVSDLEGVRDLLHCNVTRSYEELPLDLYKIYSKHRNIMLVHFECIVSQMMRVGNMRWRLVKDRFSEKPELVSILSIPQRESWLLALAFHKPKDYLIDGVLHSGRNEGILEKIMTNKRI